MSLMAEKETVKPTPRRSSSGDKSWLEDVPVWSWVGSVVLIAAVLIFDGPSAGKYALLFMAQLAYLASVLMRD
jgi:hypothetical protein